MFGIDKQKIKQAGALIASAAAGLIGGSQVDWAGLASSLVTIFV